MRCGAVIHGAFPDAIHARIFYFGVWEPALTDHFRRALRCGDIVVDIGANVGVHSLLASSLVGPQGRVHAIEASPSTFTRLRRNVEANGCANVVLHQVAVMDRHAEVTVHRNRAENIGGTTVVDAVAEGLQATVEARVEARPLDDIVPLEDLLRARVIKIDVEGAEWPVLQGMREVMDRLREDVEIVVELTPEALRHHGVTTEEFLGFFAAFGFFAYRIPNDYDPRFYLDPLPSRPTPFVPCGERLVDLVMSRVRPDAM